MSETDKFAVGYLGPAELGGWLLFLIIVLSFDALLYLLGAIAARHSYILIVWRLLLAALTASAAYFLAIRNRKGVLLAKLYFAIYLVVTLVGVARLGTTNVLRTSLTCAVTICYYSYLARSSRVKAIYFSGS